MDLTTVDTESKKSVTVNGNVYNVEEIVHYKPVIRGRATLCLKVKRDGKTRVVKNAWVEELDPRAKFEENCEEREQVCIVLSEFVSPLR
jgi:hypothetical protein